MALTRYMNYLDNIAQSPNDDYLDLEQASINSQWEMSTQRYRILEQDAVGANTYTATDISVDSATALGTSVKKPDDFKIFSYKDMSKDVTLGIMYKWENNYWICHNTSEYGSPIKSVGVRRCNNIAKWINPDDGSLNEQYCVIDYELASPSPKVNKDVEVANGHVVMIIQGNDEVAKFVERNQRLFFGGTPYKVTSINNMLQNDYVDNSTTLYYYDLYLDVILPTDNVLENIANKDEYVYTLDILENPIGQVNGFVGQLTAQVKMNGVIVDTDVSWSSNKYANINQAGQYTVIGEAGDTATLTATFGDLFTSVSIDIVANISDSYEVVISPEVTELYQSESAVISASLYKNGVKQADGVSYTASSANNNSYEIMQDGNNFTVGNLYMSQTPLILTFTSGEYSKSTTIELKALF